jgi:Fe-S-cluster containining protein
VTLNGHDAYRLSAGLRLPMRAFADMCWSVERDALHRILLDPGTDGERHWYRISLRKVPDVPEQSRCVFLLSVGDLGRCGVYALRPGVCRAYPTQLEGDLVQLRSTSYCPPGGWQLDTMDLPAFRAELLEKRRQDALYDRLVEAWNERVVSTHADLRVGDFFAFLDAAYGDLARRDPAPLSPTDEPPQSADAGLLAAALRAALPMPPT